MTHISNSRKRKRRNTIERSILPALILLVSVLLIVLLVILILQSRIKNYYETSRFETMLTSEESDSHLDGFAFDIAVVGPTTLTDDNFEAYSAVSAELGRKDMIFAKNAFERMNPASTTKIMTALIALKYGNLSDMVSVTNDAVITEPGASLAHINPGDRLSLEQLLYAMMLPSGNDAANAVAVHIGGSLESFYDIMNEEAIRIGATNTHFNNANGITDEDHYTTAYDLYLIMREALKYKEFRTITSTVTYMADYLTADGTYTSKFWKNTNKYISGLQKEPEGIDVYSGKTGTTLAALSCLVTAAKANNKDYINVILKAKNRDSLYNDMDLILNIDKEVSLQ